MQNHRWRWYKVKCVNALSGLYLISTLLEKNGRGILLYRVNALSGLYLISTIGWENEERHNLMCQCPLGLIPHFYRKENFMKRFYEFCVNALSGLYLISTVPLQKPRFYAVFRACFCRYLSEYSDNSRFSCMLTFWTYLIRCTYP